MAQVSCLHHALNLGTKGAAGMIKEPRDLLSSVLKYSPSQLPFGKRIKLLLVFRERDGLGIVKSILKKVLGGFLLRKES